MIGVMEKRKSEQKVREWDNDKDNSVILFSMQTCTHLLHVQLCIHTHRTPAEITHLVEWIADVINVFNLHKWQSSAVFSVHYVLVRRECKPAVRIGLFLRRPD